MNEQTTALTKQDSQAPARREIRVVEDDSQMSYLLDTSRFEHAFRIAGAMARASLLPKHLKAGTFEEAQANCFLIVNQAMLWGFNPFACAAETYEIGGKLGFSGKLIAAVINSSPRMVDKLSYTFNDGKGDALEITVSGRIEGEELPRTVTCRVGDVRTNNQMWTKDPQQKLVYNGAIKWGRRHMPERVMGVLTDDDAEQIKEEAGKTAVIVQRNARPDFSGDVVVDIPPAEAPAPAPEAPKPAKEKVSRKAQHPPAHDTTKEVAQTAPVAQEEAPEPTQSPTPATEPASELFNGLPELRVKLGELQISEAQVLQFCAKNKVLTELGDAPTTLEQIPSERVSKMLGHLKLAGSPLVGKLRAETV